MTKIEKSTCEEKIDEYLTQLKNKSAKYSEDELASNKDPYILIKIKQQDVLDELKNTRVIPPVDDECTNHELKKSSIGEVVVPEHIEGSELFNYEAVNHPQHYGGKDNPYEAIKVIEAWDLNFNLGNTIKYISRAGKKLSKSLSRGQEHLEDLEKARWYLNREIDNFKSFLENGVN